MISRITQIMSYYQLSPAKFAELIGVPKSGISHLISGRNKPSLDYVTRILGVFKEVDSEWLLFGKGVGLPEMPIEKPKINNQLTSFNKKLGVQAEKLANQYSKIQKIDSQDDIMDLPNGSLPIVELKPDVNPPKPLNIGNKKPETSEFESGESIDRIVIFYSSGKFKEYKPAN